MFANTNMGAFLMLCGLILAAAILDKMLNFVKKIVVKLLTK